MPHADDFRTLAEIAIALAGFTGIVVALDSRSPDGLRSTGLAHVSVRPDWLVVPVGVAILIAQFTTAAGFFSEHTHFVYFLALMFLLFAAAFDFALLLLARGNAA